MVHRFYYLKYALALVLIFIGMKIVLGDFVWDGKMPAELSLAVTALLIGGGVGYSLWKTRGGPPPGPVPAGGSGRSGLKVSSVMTTTFPTIGPEASIGEAASRMAASGNSSLLVIGESQELLGILTEGDLIHREALGQRPTTPLWRTLFTDDRTLARAFAKAYGRKVREVMSRRVSTVTEDTSVTHAAELLYSLHVKQLPVLRDGAVVGVLSRSDVIRALGRLGIELLPETAPDSVIAEELAARISRAGWIAPQQVRYSVTAGDVEYSGVVTSDDQRSALHALAEGVPGVRRVLDRLQLTASFPAQPT
jgi:CBS domain-containing protein